MSWLTGEKIIFEGSTSDGQVELYDESQEAAMTSIMNRGLVDGLWIELNNCLDDLQAKVWNWWHHYVA